MKLYIEDKDIGKTVKFSDEKRQGLYVHDDEEGVIFKSLAEHDELLVRSICDEVSSAIAYETLVSGELTHKEIEKAIAKVKKNSYGLDRLVENVENLYSKDLKPMWDKWQEEMYKQIEENLKGEE